jgi:hypothetical protein
MEVLQLGTRLEPEFVDELFPRLLVRLERLCLSPRSVEGEHELTARPLAKRLLVDERLQLANELGVVAEREPRLNQLLPGCEAKLFEPADLILRPALVREIGECGAAPERERLRQRRSRWFGLLPREGLARRRQQHLEPGDVEVPRLANQQIPAAAGQDRLGPEHLAQA